ncbi:GTPase activating protein [Ordospora colligata]|uniref:GTPase activating protein n=1 Tax=Ordospora colligata OC4 TaxID=1354746 RepID=A0A0B2UL39_9MICR|nr:GTPase activating protein [Ordospora colligata OC4]KHN70004.1 GTPase activating protein [Ordospora colligata OC4]TBU19091.1 GTPase activating protein [Ordospora colligata]
MATSGEQLFGNEVIDEKLLRDLCFGGIESKYRGIAWRVIFHIVGLRKRMHMKEIETKHMKYIEMASKIGYVCQGGYGAECKGCESKKDTDVMICGKKKTLNVSKKIMHQIDIDVKRIDMKYRICLGMDISYVYYRVLLLVAYRRPTLGYIQGMADILVPFIVVFSQENSEKMESSAYFCYSRLLDEIQHNMTGLQVKMIKRLDAVIRTIDPDYHAFLKDVGIEMHMFAFRWFNCFFIREFKVPTIYKVLDTIFASDNICESLLYFGVALLMKFKNALIGNDFSHGILFLQNIYENEWEEAEIELMLSSAKFYRSVMSGQ